ncbi:DUF397 domain-containing protein [Saccharopolyspora hordei]|uniref:DUF397 domain-containing protein n=1 Tax=Saccharopolyspora hordei TaxID=1838 RepID=A0A853APD2_9PSEU|nr:hypothetical protein [Saccharopolyspora hordei]
MCTFSPDQWFKSSYSSNPAGCVEVAMTPELVGVRDTKDRDGGTLVFTKQKWASFIASVKE